MFTFYRKFVVAFTVPDSRSHCTRVVAILTVMASSPGGLTCRQTDSILELKAVAETRPLPSEVSTDIQQA